MIGAEGVARSPVRCIAQTTLAWVECMKGRRPGGRSHAIQCVAGLAVHSRKGGAASGDECRVCFEIRCRLVRVRSSRLTFQQPCCDGIGFLSRQVEIGHASSRATAERISDESAQGTKIVFRWQMVKVMGLGRLVTLFHRVGSVARDAAQVLVGLLAFEDEA